MTTQQIIGLAVLVAMVGGGMLWMAWPWLRQMLNSGGSTDLVSGQLDWMITEFRERADQEQWLGDLGFGRHDLEVHHMVVPDRETGLPKVVYTIPSALLEARIERMLSRFVEAYRPAV